MWPVNCAMCAKILHDGGFDQARLVAAVSEMRQQVVTDLAKYSEMLLKPLKLPKTVGPKREPDEADGRDPKRVKVEKDEDGEKPDVDAAASTATIGAESLMDKNALLDFHGMKKLPSGDAKKTHPVFCPHCNVTLNWRGRAKVWQHVRGQDHRAKKAKNDGCSKKGIKVEPADVATKVIDVGLCKGLRLNGSIGRQTRLGSDLRSMWDEYAKYADLTDANAPKGVQVHQITRIFSQNDWNFCHWQCASSSDETKQVRRNGEGDATCSQCFSLASDQKFLSRVSGFVVDLDSARYLWHRLFANEKAEELEQSLRAKEIYQRRCQSTYDHLFSLDTEALYNKVRAQWHGRSGRAF